MKREENSSIFPGRLTLFILAAFLLILGTPIASASLTGQLEPPVEHRYDPAAQEVAFIPVEGWTIASALPQEDSPLVPVTQGDAVAVSLAGLPAGESASLQLLCQRQSGGQTEETQLTFQLLPEADGALDLRAYPEKSDLLNVNFRYEYSPSA